MRKARLHREDRPDRFTLCRSVGQRSAICALGLRATTVDDINPALPSGP